VAGENEGSAAGAGGLREDGGGAVALVDVAIHGHGARDLLLLLQAADGHGHVVDHAEALAVVGEGVVEAAAQVEGHAVSQRVLGRQDGAARGQPEGAHQLRRVRDLEQQFLLIGERAGLELADVVGGVHQQDVVVRGRLRLQEVLRRGQARFQQPLVDEPVLLGGEDMRAQGQVVAVAVDQLKGQHGVRKRVAGSRGNTKSLKINTSRTELFGPDRVSTIEGEES